MEPTTVCCATCPMFVQMNENTGACHAAPPTPAIIMGAPTPLSGGQPTLQVRGLWPPVQPTEWCASHPMFLAGVGRKAVADERLSADAEGHG